MKTYIPVAATFTPAGELWPRAFLWEGERIRIDRVLQFRPAAADRLGSGCDRFTVSIRGQTRLLYFERSGHVSGPQLGRWFVEQPA